MYWPGKRELFLQVRMAVVAQIATWLLEAMVPRKRLSSVRLRASFGANLEAHYQHPEYQAVLLPVASLPLDPQSSSPWAGSSRSSNCT